MLSQVFQDARQGKFSVRLVWALDRLSREGPLATLEIVHRLGQSGVQVPLARQMRQMVRDQLTQGASQAEILEFFAQRYGPDILASPPKSGFNLLAWVFPVVGMAAALIAGWLVIRSMAARRLVSPELAVPQQPDLEPFLNQVDAEIGLEPSTPTSDERQPGVEPQREGGSFNDG